MVAIDIENRPKRAQKLPAEERRGQILDAATAIFARKGFAGAGTAEIAAAAGIGEPTIYRYFPSKLDLYAATVQHCADMVMDAWAEIAKRNEDPLNALLSLGQWYHESMLERPDVLRLRFRSIMEAEDTGLMEWARETQRRFRGFIHDLFVRAKEQGRLNPSANPDTMAWLFMSIGALLDQTNLLGLSDDISPRDMVAMANLMFEGRLQP